MKPPSASNDPAAELRNRIAALTPRERHFLAAGALALLLFLAYLLWPSEEQDNVELAQAPPPAAQPAFAPSPVAPPPPMPAAPALPQANPGAAAGLVLRGVMGGGPSGGAAIIGFPDGTQRAIRVGREFLPGMTLRSIGVNYAIASSGGGELRMELNKTGATAVAPASSSAVAPSPNPLPGAQESLQYRLGLAPQKVNGRIRGFAIRPDAKLPMLERAGLRPGDVLVAINGQAVESEEKVLELPQEIAGAYTAEFEFMRGGKRMKAAVEVNKRPTL